MVKFSLFKDSGLSTSEEYLDYFLETLIATNKTYGYFVDWPKVKENIEKYKVEIGILSSLVGSKDPKEDLKKIILKYPEVLPVIPLIVAFRVKTFSVLDNDFKVQQFDFLPFKVDEKKVEQVLSFCEKVGILDLMENIKVLRDYLVGVEVGLDSNARKNRSGEIMETKVTEILEKIDNIEILYQKSFKSVEPCGATKIPAQLAERRFDFCVKKKGFDKRINIEVNYFGGGGSKPQEIVDSYIQRMHELKEAGWDFIWITDGDGWKSSKNQIHKAIKEVDYLLNLDMVKKGYLEKILKAI
jgi:type II restriction enzyme